MLSHSPGVLVDRHTVNKINMNRVLFVLLAVCAATAVDGFSGSLRVRFGNGAFGEDYFIELPQTLSDAVGQGWTQLSRPDATLPSLKLFCHGSYILCLLYDDTGLVAGLQVSIPADQVIGSPYDWRTRGFISWSPRNNEVFWSNQQYFVTEEYLAIDAEERLSKRDYTKTLQLDGVWVHGINRAIVQIPIAAAGIVANGFTQQSCIPFMGRHYFYNMSAAMPCSAETTFPWFGLTHDDELVGSGMITFGKFPEIDGDWFERPVELAVRAIVPRGPDCLYELAATVGIITMHIYYIDAPNLLLC